MSGTKHLLTLLLIPSIVCTMATMRVRVYVQLTYGPYLDIIASDSEGTCSGLAHKGDQTGYIRGGGLDLWAGVPGSWSVVSARAS